MRVHRILALFVVILCLALAGCATTQTKPESILYKAESLYISQRVDFDSNFDFDTTTQTYKLKPTVTAEQKEVLRTRGKALDDFKLAIDTYRAFVVAGQVPSMEAEQKLIAFIRKFSEGG